MRRLLLVLTALALLPASAAQASACKRVTGKIGYYARDIRASGGAACAPARRKLKAWLNGPVAHRIAGPKGWSCTHTSTKKQITYSCDPGKGRVRFVVRFSLG